LGVRRKKAKRKDDATSGVDVMDKMDTVDIKTTAGSGFDFPECPAVDGFAVLLFIPFSGAAAGCDISVR
jgi:hypothetical protein